MADEEVIETESTETEKTTADDVVIVPTKFEIFEDGKSHNVLYYADTEHTYFNDFTSVSRPDLGINSVSFISAFVDAEGENLHAIDADGSFTINSEADARKVYDYASVDWLDDNEYARFIPTDGKVGIINKDFELDGESPTVEEMKKLGAMYKLIVTDPVFQDTTKDGNTVFSCLCGAEAAANSDVKYYGVMTVRFKSGEAQGVYYVLRGDLEENFRYANYTIQSLSFVD